MSLRVPAACWRRLTKSEAFFWLLSPYWLGILTTTLLCSLMAEVSRTADVERGIYGIMPAIQRWFRHETSGAAGCHRPISIKKNQVSLGISILPLPPVLSR